MTSISTPSDRTVPTIEELIAVADDYRARYPRLELEPAKTLRTAYDRCTESYNTDAPLLDEWYGCYTATPCARPQPTYGTLSKDEFRVVTVCLGGWAINPIIFGTGDRGHAWDLICKVCHIDSHELEIVFHAMDAITTMS